MKGEFDYMNQLTIIGNLTRDPEARTTKGGDNVTTFTVAVNRSSGADEADFFRVSAWGNMGENCAKYLAKGRKVAVIGSVHADAYTDKDGNPAASLEVSAARVEFLSPVTSNNEDSKTQKNNYRNNRR